MGLFSRLLGRRHSNGAARPSPVDHPDAGLAGRRRILDYLRGRWAGRPADEAFERAGLNDLGLTSLDLAEVLSAQIDEQGLAEEEAVTFVAIGGPACQKQANLLRRVRVLAQQFGEADRHALLSSGVVGDRSEIAPFAPEFDSVGFVVRYCGAVKAWCDEHRFSA